MNRMGSFERISTLWQGHAEMACCECRVLTPAMELLMRMDRSGHLRLPMWVLCRPCAEKYPRLWRKFIIEETKRRMTS